MTIRPELIQRLRDKRAKLSEHVSREKLDALHAKGQLSARERIGELVISGSFQEFGLHAAHNATHFGMAGALKCGIPVVGFNDGGGARIQEGVNALSAYGRIFYHNTLLSGVVPQISVIAGPCAGGAAYSPALTDFVIMIENTRTCSSPGPR
jgi:propionyl-CoA carboxylase beta chain